MNTVPKMARVSKVSMSLQKVATNLGTEWFYAGKYITGAG